MTTEQIFTNARWTFFVWAWRDIGKAIAVPFSVSLWGSDPDAGNDDCWTGEDFATRDEALAAYRALYKFPTDDIAEGCPEWQFAMIDGPDTHETMRNPDERTARRWRREMAQSDTEWQNERAHQAGMAFGVDGYNDEMGW